MLVGKWFGEIEIAGVGKRKWIIERYPNGTYQTHYRVFTEDGHVRDTVEAGHWGVSGPVYFSINRATRPIDGRFRDTDPGDPKYYDAYEVIELTHHVFRFKHSEHGAEFEMKKVDDDFELPRRSDFSYGSATAVLWLDGAQQSAQEHAVRSGSPCSHPYALTQNKKPGVKLG